jgi:5-formyltetrahydrofolate cyclo-ligase
MRIDATVPTSDQKAALRTQICAVLKQMSPAGRETASRKACALLESQPLWHEAQSVLFYAPMPEELDVWPLLERALAVGKTVLLPRFLPEQNEYAACHIRDPVKDLRTGKFGIREPRDSCERILLKRLDLLLVPGIAFDLEGHRLGRGRGFYDRLLAVLQGPACGVAFDQQIVAVIPREPHDMRLNCILTPTRWQCGTGLRAVLK